MWSDAGEERAGSVDGNSVRLHVGCLASNSEAGERKTGRRLEERKMRKGTVAEKDETGGTSRTV